MGDIVRESDFLVLTVVEARDRDRDRCDPVGDRETRLGVLLLEFADADQNIGVRDLEGEIVERLFAEAVQVGVPRFTRADVVAASACIGQYFVAAVLHGNGMGLPYRRGRIEYRVERAVF